MKKKLFLLLIFFIFSFVSCVSNSQLHTVFVTEAQNGNYELAYTNIQDAPKNLYSSYDDVLKMLDLGLLAHYSGLNQESVNYLNQAENLIYEKYSKSVTQNISSYLLNDNVIDYTGEEYEDIYVNLFKCLSFIAEEEYDSAFVEIRRFNNKLKTLSVKYQEKIYEVKNHAKIETELFNQDDYKINFYDSVFARYLSMILYLYEGDIDSAKIDYNYLVSAFNTQKKLYNFSFPKQIEENFKTEKNKVRLNAVAFSGIAPRKYEESISNIYYGFKIALPVMKNVNSNVATITLMIVNQETGEVYKKQFEKIESISNIAIDTFKQKQSLIYTKSIARAILKTGTTSMLENYKEEKNSPTLEILHAISLISNQITEVADVRTSKYFPSSVYISGIDLFPGKYDICVSYKSSSGIELYRKVFNDYDVSNKKLNFLEAVCLK